MPIRDPALWQPLENWLASPEAEALSGAAHRKLVKYQTEARTLVTDYARCAYLARIDVERTVPPPLVADVARLHDTMRLAALPALPRHLTEPFSPFDDLHEGTIPLYTAEFDAAPDPRLWLGRRERRQMRFLQGALAGMAALVALGLAAHVLDLPLSPGLWTALIGANFVWLVIASFNQPMRKRWL